MVRCTVFEVTEPAMLLITQRKSQLFRFAWALKCSVSVWLLEEVSAFQSAPLFTR